MGCWRERRGSCTLFASCTKSCVFASRRRITLSCSGPRPCCVVLPCARLPLALAPAYGLRRNDRPLLVCRGPVDRVALLAARHAADKRSGGWGERGAGAVGCAVGREAKPAWVCQLGCAGEARRRLPDAGSCLSGRLLRRPTPARPGPSTRNTRCGTTRTSTSSAMQGRRTHANGLAKRRKGRFQLGALQGMDAHPPRARLSAWKMLRICC